MFHDRSLLGGSVIVRPMPKMIAQYGGRKGGYTRDEFFTYDKATIDSTGAFLVGQLEKLDLTLHQPLFDFQWSRDIDLRSDVTIADESSSFTVSSFGASGGGFGGQGTPAGNTQKSWISKNATALPSASLDKGKVATPMTEWGMEISYTIFELEQSMKLGTSVDTEKTMVLNTRYQADVDAQVYTGDKLLGLYGMTNLDGRSDSSAVTNVASVPAGTGGAHQWMGTTKTPQDILNDFNEILMSRWAAMGFVLEDTVILLPTSQYGYISTQNITQAGGRSILTYILENNFVTKSGSTLTILPSKWLNGRGVGGTPESLGTTDRMMAYSKKKERIRFPLTPLQRLPIQFRSVWQIVPYYSKIGAVECVYPECVAYRDGL